MTGVLPTPGSRSDPVSVREAWAGPVIDADVHAVVPSIDTLRPYLAAHWREFIDERGFGDPVGLAVTYPPGAPTTIRADWREDHADGGLEALRRHVLDPLGVEAAVLNCYYAVDSIRHPDFAAAIASAVNDWIAAEWLDPEPRLRSSITVPARQPDQMIAEIRRLSGDRRFVQVLAPVRADRPYGNRIWHPVLREVAEHGLVLGLHWGGSSDGPPTPTGWPSWFVEEYAAEQQVFMAQLTSLVAEGAFQAAPGLRVTIGEIGFAWVPSLMWRLDKEWKGLRRDIPWVDTPPSELIREHVRLTTCPLDMAVARNDAPASIDPGAELAEVVSWLGSEKMLMFATDYPHAHEAPIRTLLERLPETMRAAVMAESARAFYRLEPGR
jgi:hypothetical protein